MQQTHTRYLDAIRGLAALAVMTEHYVIAYGLPCQSASCRAVLDASPLNVWWDGSAAVALFFVLSGLVLSLKYFDGSREVDLSAFSLGSYLVGRIVRIGFPYWTVLGISAVLYRWVTGFSMPQGMLPVDSWLAQMWHGHPLSDLAMLRESWLFAMPDMIVLLPQSWTLAVELTLSLLLPIGLVLMQRGWVWLVFFVLFGVYGLGLSPFLLHFALGLLIARYRVMVALYLLDRPQLRLAVLFAGLMLYATGTLSRQTGGDALAWQTMGLGAGLILLFALCSIRTQRLLSGRLLRAIGRVSYSAYLIHMAVLICVTPWLLLGLEWFTSNLKLLWWMGWLTTISLVQILSLGFYHVLELPSIRLGKQIMQWLQRRTDSSHRVTA